MPARGDLMRVWLICTAVALAVGGVFAFRAQESRTWLAWGLEDFSPPGRPILGRRDVCLWALYEVDRADVAPTGFSPGPFTPTVPFGDGNTPHADHPANLCPRDVMPPEFAARVAAARDDPGVLWHTNRAGVWLWSPATRTASLAGILVR